MHGVKETKELVSGLLAIVKVIAPELKNGFQVMDLVAAFSAVQDDAVKKAAIEAALKNVVDVPAEVKDMSFAEVLELVTHLLAEIPSLLEAFKKAE